VFDEQRQLRRGEVLDTYLVSVGDTLPEQFQSKNEIFLIYQRGDSLV
jgi:hypothetical protein